MEEVPTRDIRQRLAEFINRVVYSDAIIGITRDNNRVAAIVSWNDARFLERVKAATTTEELVAALQHRPDYGPPTVNPVVAAGLSLSLQDRVRERAVRIIDLPKVMPAKRDGRTVSIEFADGVLILEGWLNLTDSDNQTFLRGSIDLKDAGQDIVLELSNGQKIENLERSDSTLDFRRFKIDGEINLELTKIHYL